jgi:16S rRNA A1518/A1519 N6-dimethyltransferase RsmA/KsgA/DIM1 with predicted DNA glycosylase/AP lyase activity
LKIQEFISSLPQSVVKGEDISIPDNVIRKLFKLANLRKRDTFYDLGCGLNNTVAIAVKEFKVRKSVGIEIRKSVAIEAGIKIADIKNAKIVNNDIRTTSISDASVLLYWFTDPDTSHRMIKRFENELKIGARIITIWSPLDLMLPSKTLRT